MQKKSKKSKAIKSNANDVVQPFVPESIFNEKEIEERLRGEIVQKESDKMEITDDKNIANIVGQVTKDGEISLQDEGGNVKDENNENRENHENIENNEKREKDKKNAKNDRIDRNEEHYSLSSVSPEKDKETVMGEMNVSYHENETEIENEKNLVKMTEKTVKTIEKLVEKEKKAGAEKKEENDGIGRTEKEAERAEEAEEAEEAGEDEDNDDEISDVIVDLRETSDFIPHPLDVSLDSDFQGEKQRDEGEEDEEEEEEESYFSLSFILFISLYLFFLFNLIYNFIKFIILPYL